MRRALDDVDVDNVANLGEEIDHLLLVSIDGHTANKDRTTVDIVFAEVFLVGIGARELLLLLHIESIDAISVVFLDGL